MDTDLLLGLDLGTTRCKAALVDRSGRERVVASTPTPFTAQGDRIEMPVESLIGTVRSLVTSLHADPGRIAGIGIAGMAECGAPLDRAGRPLAPVIAWHDPRGEDVVTGLAAHFGEALALRTGQRLRTVSSVAKLGWLVRHESVPVGRWLGVPELCLKALTQSEATEHSLASRTGCYAVLERRWLPEVAEVAGFPAEVFPPIRASGTTMGRTGPDVASWGLPTGIPVTLAGHDHLAGAVGAAAPATDLVNSVGTAETVLGCVDSAPDLATALRLRTPVSVALGGRGWVILAGAARAGVVLSRACALLGRTLAELDALAATPGITAGAVPVDDDLLARLQSGAPAVLPGAPAGAVWLGLLRALVGRTRDATQRVLAQVPADRLQVIGGGAQSAPWLAEKAAALPLAIRVPAIQQAAARGAAVMAGVAAGWWASPGHAPAPPARTVAVDQPRTSPHP